ncbi:RNA-binding protein, partial [Trypanosoma cruzi]
HAGQVARGTPGLIGIFRHLAIHHGRLGGQYFAARSGKYSSKSQAMAWELRRIYEFLDSRRIQASFAYVRSAENPADGMPRGRVFTLQELAKGSGGVLWLENPKVCHFVSDYLSDMGTKDHVSGQQNIYVL